MTKHTVFTCSNIWINAYGFNAKNQIKNKFLLKKIFDKKTTVMFG